MERLSTRVLVVEDSEPFRKFVCSMLGEKQELEVIGEVSDGLQAVQKAEELQPDLITLDVGLPYLNGIEAARKIRIVSPESKILFLSQESSQDVVQEALDTGARGYVVKVDAGSELLEAVNSVLRGGHFVGRRFAEHDFPRSHEQGELAAQGVRAKDALAPLQQPLTTAPHHVAGFYSDDAGLLEDLTQFVAGALNARNAAIVVATESHRDSLLLRLQTHGLDIGAAIEQGRYFALDAAEALSCFMLNGLPDPKRFLKLLSNLITAAAEAAKGKHARVAIFGECVHLLWTQGNLKAAIQLEKLGNELARTFDLDILCGYCPGTAQCEMESHIFQTICAEHSAVLFPVNTQNPKRRVR